MKKSLKRIGICALLSCLVWGVSLLKDKHALQNQLIRLHVVAASDTAEDQAIKLQVRDAVVKDLQKNTAKRLRNIEREGKIKRTIKKGHSFNSLKKAETLILSRFPLISSKLLTGIGFLEARKSK